MSSLLVKSQVYLTSEFLEVSVMFFKRGQSPLNLLLKTIKEMARTILDEYKTSDWFWVEAVNTTCHATNRLYLHKLLKKTSYELLTGKKSSVCYF
jgi:hypothetical protein